MLQFYQKFTNLHKVYLCTQTPTSDMVFSLYCTAELIFVFLYVLFCSFIIIVFLCLCFCALYFVALVVILSLLLAIMGGQHDGLLLSGSPLIVLHIYIFHGK